MRKKGVVNIMEYMTSLERKIQEIMKKKSEVLERKSTSKYKCKKCKDTGWVEGENGVIYCECIVKDISSKQWKAFGVNPNIIKRINDYVIHNDKQYEAKEIAIKYVNDFEIIKSCQVNGLALLGQSGSGKTHLIIAIGAALINRGYKVVYMPYIESISHLKANVINEEYYSKVISKYKTADLLIIDDLFKDKLKNGKIQKEKFLKESDIKHIYAIINYRYINNLPIIVSSEALPDTLIELDEGICGRLIERAKDRIVVFDKLTDNYRFKRWIIE